MYGIATIAATCESTPGPSETSSYHTPTVSDGDYCADQKKVQPTGTWRRIPRLPTPRSAHCILSFVASFEIPAKAFNKTSFKAEIYGRNPLPKWLGDIPAQSAVGQAARTHWFPMETLVSLQWTPTAKNSLFAPAARIHWVPLCSILAEALMDNRYRSLNPWLESKSPIWTLTKISGTMPAESGAHRVTVENLRMYDSDKKLKWKSVKTFLSWNETE